MDKKTTDTDAQDTGLDQDTPDQDKENPVEIGGPKGPEPTRFGDWEKGGRCTDF